MSRYKKISKFLSLVLRHRPERIGLELDPGGWAPIDELIAKANKHRGSIDRDLLLNVVEESSKRRFEFSSDGEKIRARYGHSIPVNLDLEPLRPPETLYHGTAKRFWAAIQEDGLQSQSRNYVHLSTDRETAIQVGRRHGRVVILAVQARKLHAAGHTFYKPSPGVWLVDSVPPQYLHRQT
jgi:putative RNA 2'-phosphotransferase